MNTKYWELFREVPVGAQKKIGAGRLSGMTDINPVWRMKILTETFGPVGFGWKYEIVESRLEKVDNGEVAAFVFINLFVNVDGKWSEAIPGSGGSMFVANEKNGPHTSDECFKMALTDAISVSCKALGIGADVYWQGDRTKYSAPAKEEKKEDYTKFMDEPVSSWPEAMIGEYIFYGVKTADGTKQNITVEQCYGAGDKGVLVLNKIASREDVTERDREVAKRASKILSK
jgi:hypothetical protein